MYLTVNPNRPLHYQHVNLENKPVSKKQTRQTNKPAWLEAVQKGGSEFWKEENKGSYSLKLVAD